MNSNHVSMPSPPLPPSLPYAADLSLSSLLTELNDSLSKSRELDRELGDLFSSRVDLERAVKKSTPQLIDSIDLISRQHAGMGAVVAGSNASAQALSSRVRELDTVAERVSAALGRVESVLALRHTIARVKDKLQSAHYTAAAEELYRALFLATPIENDVSFSSLLELETKLREEVQKECVQRMVRQARLAELSAASDSPPADSSSADLFKLARLWPKLGWSYRGLTLHCAQVRVDCLSLIHRHGWSVANQHEHALIDYARCVGSIIDTVNNAILQHLLLVQNTFGSGAQIRLIQELVAHVIDAEVAGKLMSRFMEEKKIRDPKGGTLNANTDDIITKIKQMNQKVMNAQSGSGAANNQQQTAAQNSSLLYYNSNPSSFGSLLHIPSLDELLDEIKFLAHDIENFLGNMHQLTVQSTEFLAEAVANEREQRENKTKQIAAAGQQQKNTNNTTANTGTTTANTAAATTTASAPSTAQLQAEVDEKKKDDLMNRFLSLPSLSTLPSIHAQHDRVLTMLHRQLQSDKHGSNLLEIPLQTPDAPGAPLSTPLPPAHEPLTGALLTLPANSPYLISGFGVEQNVATASRLYDVQLTLIGKYVLIEEYYMNYNVEKAIAIDEHDGTASVMSEDGSYASSNTASSSSSHHDDLELELEQAELRSVERERAAAAASGGLQSLASAISNNASATTIDPYLYLTGMGASPLGIGLSKSFLSKFSLHKTSTLVDNVCFIYKKCLQRALKTSNRDAIYSILLRVHENFHKKLRRVYETAITYYETRYSSKKKSSLTYALFQNPTAYLLPQSRSSNNILGTWASGGAVTAADLRKKATCDISLILTVNNLDSTLENMQALLKYIENALEELFGEENTPAAQSTADGSTSHSSVVPTSHSSNYSRGLSLDQMKDKSSEFHSSFHQFDHFIHRGLQFIADNCWLRLVPRLSLLHTHANELYGSTEVTSASAAEKGEQIIGGYMEIFRRDCMSMEKVLTENNFYQFIFKLIKLTVRYIENLVLPRYNPTHPLNGGSSGSNATNSADTAAATARPLQFTQNGGVQFDKQIRTLTSFFTNDVAAILERHFADNFFLYLQPTPPSSSSSSSLGLDSHPSSSVDHMKQWRVSFSGSAQARQLFSKLAHIGSILSVDKPAEVLEYTERELFNLKKEEVTHTHSQH